MLYDPKWEAKPQTLAHFIAWLETQPAAEPYNFNNCDGRCLLGLYMESIEMAWSMPAYERLAGKLDPSSSRGCFPIGYAQPNTFGAALDRARAALGAQP